MTSMKCKQLICTMQSDITHFNAKKVVQQLTRNVECQKLPMYCNTAIYIREDQGEWHKKNIAAYAARRRGHYMRNFSGSCYSNNRLHIPCASLSVHKSLYPVLKAITGRKVVKS